MQKLSREDLFNLERYAEIRTEFRTKVMAHKKHRQVLIGPNACLYFEDRLTMQYQIQEMLRVERIFEKAGIQDELDAYNPLIPEGTNWKATFMVEYDDAAERKDALAKLIGVEDRVWVQVADFDRVWAIADEDLERSTEEKTSSVHFLRFNLTADMIKAAKEKANLAMGIDHKEYCYHVDSLPDDVYASLLDDLD